ncbi:MAG: zinc-binding dehydrogenase [Rhizobiales bacterium]|nr:zinc-binding dehydrogenase [Hyphomicrobiales bacterium]
MRAVVVDAFGPFEAGSFREIPDPVPGPGEVLVKIHAAAANFVDLLVIDGSYQKKPKLPFVPGKCAAGIVKAVGSQVTAFKPGDRVLALCEEGGYGTLVAEAAARCFRLPDMMSFVDAASMSTIFDTAWFALRERGRLQPGEAVLVLGASGGVGLAAVQLAKALGAKVLAGIANPDKADIVRDAGADAIVDLSRPELRDSLRDQVYATTEKRGADIILDMLGGDVFDAGLRALAWRGRLVVIGFASGRIPTIKANYLLLKNIEVSGVQVSNYRERAPQEAAQCFAELLALYQAGKITAPPTTVLPLKDFAHALRALRDRAIRGRIVLVPDGASSE